MSASVKLSLVNGELIISSGDDIVHGKKRPNKGQSLLDFPEEYCVIDIETTGLSPDYDEIIELGAIKVKNENIVEKYDQLIKPKYELDEFITELTGITDEMLNDSPSIDEVLPDYLKFIGDSIVIGHNVNFDVNFLYDTALTNGLKFENDFVDTMRLSRRLSPEMKHHRLKDCLKEYSIDRDGREHRALSDCEVTHRLYLHLKGICNENYGGVINYKKTKNGIKAKDIVANSDHIDESNPLYGKTCVFTGKLEKMLRKDAMQIVADLGGIPSDSITKGTNILILGNNDYCSTIKDGKSSKQKKAEKLILQGNDLIIMPENVFYDMIIEEDE